MRGFLTGLFKDLPDVFAPPRSGGGGPLAARAAIESRVAHWAPLVGVRPRRVSVRDARTRWGSCSAQGSLSFSWRLSLAPVEVLDYVVVHELAHLHELNHSKRFWDHVRRHCPEHKERRRWLRENGAALMRRRERKA